jgi:hypothetical protein
MTTISAADVISGVPMAHVNNVCATLPSSYPRR